MCQICVSTANMDYFFKAVSSTVTAVAGGTAAAAKALAETRVEVAKGISEGFQEAMAEKDRACTGGEKRLVIVDLLTKPVAGAVSAGIKGIAKAPRKVVEGAVEANTDDVFKAIGVTAAGLAGGTIGVMKAVVDTSVDVVKGVKEGLDETRNEVDTSSMEEEGLMAYADVLTKPVASGISAGIKGIAQAPRKVMAGTAEGLEAVSANMDYFFKAVSDTAAAVAGGTVAAAKALVDTSVDAAKGFSEGVQEAIAENNRARTEEEKIFAFVDLLTKPVAGGVSAGIKGIAKAPRKVVEGAVEANSDDVYKAIGATAAGVAGGTIGVVKAVVDTSVDIVKGVTDGFEEAKTEVDSACSEEQKAMALVDVLTTPVAGGVSAGIKTIAQTPKKFVAGVVKGVEAVIDE
ncbi:uncharacterized protein LOC108413925 isoform X1 [Pygocentrus nattereri]|uniref:uncharacterized protein LOC108413925 isoform X1 n=2 Tax=Pygocentrus nattereri TaxID=42514 RepID=UPI001891B305|nr:uncharacterized protein LOC108413925 isoform X1 [Pygocentrus nattereri]